MVVAPETPENHLEKFFALLAAYRFRLLFVLLIAIERERDNTPFTPLYIFTVIEGLGFIRSVLKYRHYTTIH
jgi:hypothetical protein